MYALFCSKVMTSFEMDINSQYSDIPFDSMIFISFCVFLLNGRVNYIK